MRTTTQMMLIALAAAGTAAAQPSPPSQTQTFKSVTVTGRGQLGFTALEISDDLRAYFGAPKDAGVLVDRLQPDRPAAKAGVHVGDVVIAVDSKPAHDVRELIGDVSQHEKGDTVALELVRAGKRMTVRATLDADAPTWQSMGPMFDGKMLDGHLFDQQGLEDIQRQLQQMEQRLQKLERT